MGLFTSTLLFFVITWCLGYPLSKLLKTKQDLIELNIMRIGFGLGGFAVLTIIIGTIGIVLDLWVILGLSVLFAAITALVPLLKDKNKKIELKFGKFKLKKSYLIYLMLIIMFIVTLQMYSSGANKYPYLEDDDPWAHAMGAKYVAMEKNFYDEGLDKDYPFGHHFYLQPYPPTYDVLMGVLLQAYNSVPEVLKFSNALLISLSLLFFFFLARNILKSDTKAIIATFILFVNPSYMSHFIWALSLNVPLGITMLYVLTKKESFNIKDKGILLLLSIMIASMAFTQPSSTIKFMILVGLYWVGKWIVTKKADWLIVSAVILGIVISLIWWAPNLDSYIKANSPARVTAGEEDSNFLGQLNSFFSPDSGSATRPYTVDDFFVAKTSNMINNPVGWGMGITILVLLGLFVMLFYFTSWRKKEKEWMLPVLLWFLFTFILVNSATFRTPGFFSFRTWLLMAIPVAIICAEAVYFLASLIKSVGKNFNIKIPISTIILVVLIAVYFTAFPAKYAVNTSFWGPGGSFQAIEEAIGYSWLSGLPTDTKVFALCPERPRNKELPGFEDAKVIGYGAFSCGWCQDVIDYREIAFNQTPEDFHTWLKDNKYEYVTSDLLCVRDFGPNATGNKLTSYIQSGLFDITYGYPQPPNQPLFFVFKVK